MGNGWIALAVLALVGAMGTGSAHAQEKCWGPQWRTVSDPRLGISAEFSADTSQGYGELGGFLTLTRSERARPGGEIGGRCSSFSVSTLDLRGQTLGNVEGYFDAEQKRYMKNLRDVKLVSSRRLTVGGHPAREFTYSFTIDYFFTTATHRNLLVSRGDRIHAFQWTWGDGGPAPPDSERTFNSIRMIPVKHDPHLASESLLAMVVREYWGYYPSSSREFFTPGLKAIAEPKRKQEAAMVKAYGYFENPQFLRMENGYRVFRIKHDKAVVDWYIQDDGQKISAITWKQVS